MKDFGDSDLGHLIGVAIVAIAILIGASLLVNSCSTAVAACAEAGGSWDGDNASCTVPDGNR